MRCSAIRVCLQVHPGKVALVVSTENITTNLYLGNNRPMLVPGALLCPACPMSSGPASLARMSHCSLSTLLLDPVLRIQGV